MTRVATSLNRCTSSRTGGVPLVRQRARSRARAGEVAANVRRGGSRISTLTGEASHLLGARLRIGFDARLVAYRQAGISRYATSLARALVAAYPEHEFTIFIGRGGRPVVGPHPRVRHRTLFTPPHHRLEPLALRIELGRARLDVYHGPDFFAPNLPARVATVVTIHDLYFLHDQAALDAPSRRYYQQALSALDRADAIVAVSEQTRRDLHRLVNDRADRVTVVNEAAGSEYRPLTREGVSRAVERLPAAAPSAATSRLLDGEADPYILFVGTIEPRKNLLMLFDAYREYRRRAGRDGARLVLVGASGWRNAGELAAIAQLEGAGAVTWLGPVADELLPLLYNRAAALVVPSRFEGFGLTALEGLACGVPVLASNVGGLPEVVGDAALLLPPDDPAAWATAMIDVSVNADLSVQLRHAGPERAKRFSWARAAAETMAVYQSAVSRKGLDLMPDGTPR